MLRSNAAALYGPRTMLYGTLLPSPMIGEKLARAIRSVGDAGHETGVHGWDHIRWHDKVDRMSPAAIERDVSRAHETFETIFGRKAHSSAAPGWHACRGSLEAQEKRGLLYASDTRGGPPCFLEADGKRFNTLEIPSTLPTWDEMLGDPSLPDENAFVDYFARAVKETEVHSIHTEVEATAHLNLFRRQIEAWKTREVAFVTLEDIAKEQLKDKSKIPVRPLERIEIPNRAGQVSSSIHNFRGEKL